MLFSIWFWYHAFDTFSRKSNFLFFFLFQCQKGDFIRHEQLIQTTNFNQSHIAINLWTCLPWWPSHLLTCIIWRLFLFQIYYIFLRGSYNVNMLLKMPLFWTFWMFNLPLFVIFYIHPTCTYHVRPASIMSICQFFLTSLCFCVLSSPDMHLSWQYATNLPLF